MFGELSRRQKQLLGGMALANLLMLAVIGALTLPQAPGSPASPLSTPAPPDAVCQSLAARALAERGAAGSVTLGADGSIGFVMSGADPVSAWDALAVSAELPTRHCGPYDPIRVDVPDPSLAENQRLVVQASWADVRAWSQGRIDDETLSQRTRRSAYTRPAEPLPTSAPRP